MTKYKKLEQGEGVRLNLDEDSLHLACCECGSVEILQFHHIKKNIWDFAFFRKKRATSQLRRNNYGYLQQEGKLKV